MFMVDLRRAILVMVCFTAAAGAQPGEVLWRVPVESVTPGWRPSLGPDGTIYWDAPPLRAVAPDGVVLWTRPVGDGKPVAVDAEGAVYSVSQHTMHALTAAGGALWDLPLPVSQGFIGGPTLGPDGNIYATLEGVVPGTGMLSVDPAGSLRWSYPGFVNRGGAPGSEIVFGSMNRLYKSEEVAPTQGDLEEGLLAFDLDGAFHWAREISAVGRQPVVSPTTDYVHVSVSRGAVRSYRPDGSVAWQYAPDDFSQILAGPAVGPDGAVFIVTDSRRLISVTDQGQTRWVRPDAVPPGFPRPIEVSPDGSMLVFGTSGCFGGACPGHVVAHRTSDGELLWDRELPIEEGGRVPTVETQPRFSADGTAVYLGAASYPSFDRSFLYALRAAGVPACAADFNRSGAVDSQDFFDYLSVFFAVAPRADFNRDDRVNSQDFFDFLVAFFAGC